MKYKYQPEYKLISSIHKNEFQTLLNRAIDEGWSIEGNIVTTYRPKVDRIEFSILVKRTIETS